MLILRNFLHNPLATHHQIHMMQRLFLFILICLPTLSLSAQELSLQDQNGDGLVTLIGFGDSITTGVGDGIPAGVRMDTASDIIGPGYLQRISQLLGIQTGNYGRRGELFTTSGMYRLVSVLNSTSADYYSVMEGANDGTFQASPTTYRIGMQKIINVASSLNKQLILMTLPPTCCNHGSSTERLAEYSTITRTLSTINSVALVDIEQSWLNTCAGSVRCTLLNLPEGLHPNSKGYDFIGQMLVAALTGIDLLTSEGARTFEETFNLPAEMLAVNAQGE